MSEMSEREHRDIISATPYLYAAMREVADYREALREICAVCAKPFGKDARRARRIALEALAKWGVKA